MNIFGRSLTLQMAIATLLGLLCGIFFGESCALLGSWANAYIMILKATAIPYLIIALMHGIGQMSYAEAQQILKKGILFIAIGWTINLAIVYLLAFLFPQSENAIQGGSLPSQAPPINFAELLIPDNIFYALSNNVIPAVVIFSLFIGLSLMHIKEKQACLSLLETGIDTLTRITRWISKITPYGTFLIIATQAGTIHFTTIKQIGTYILLYILGATLVIFWIFPRFMSTLTPISASKWIKDLAPILILAYTTNTVIVCLPYIIQLVQKQARAQLPEDKAVTLPTQGIVSVMFNLPLATLFIALFVLFLSIFYQISLSFTGHLELLATTFLTGLGAIGIGSWINSLTFLLESLGMPQEGIKLYLTTVPFTAGLQSMISSMEIASLSLLIILVYRASIHYKWQRILKKSLITILPIFLLTIGLKTWNFLPKIENPAPKLTELTIQCPVKVSVAREKPAPLSHQDSQQDSLTRILQSKTLRVGYCPDVPPFCFFNEKEELVGYDVAFACKLASDLECDLTFVPLTYGNLQEELNQGLYDIGMSAISITEKRLKSLCFSQTYIQGKYVLITTHAHKKLCAKNPTHKKLKIATLRGSSLNEVAQIYFPHNELLLLNDFQEFATMEEPCALLSEEHKATCWVLNNPQYTFVFPRPDLGMDHLAYPVRGCDIRLLSYLNQWLRLKEEEGFSEEQYQIWILRKTNTTTTTEPRWSVLHNLLKVKRR